MATYTYGVRDQGRTVFQTAPGRVWLSRLCGVPCGYDNADGGPLRAQGLAILATNWGRFEADQLSLVVGDFTDGEVLLKWQAAEGAIEYESRWSFCAEAGVWSRKDRLFNRGATPLTTYRCQARFVFPPTRYELYVQDSRWCNENQGQWLALPTGELKLGCEWGRSTQGGTPYLGLREVGGDSGVAFHVLPQGNWTIRASAHAVMNGLPSLVIELGLADEDLRLVLASGATLDLPELLIQELPHGQPYLAAPQLHRYVQRHLFAAAKPEAPVVYNTWFDQFEVLDRPRLRQQLAAAHEVGCEAFVIDAGWYGPDGSSWWLQAGDWREKTDAAFYGQMREFADEVRAAGLGFGLWMEPERFGPQAPIRHAHPEWFIAADGPMARIDLEKPTAYAYLCDEISRLVETYDLAWMKVDFNFSLGYDASDAELLRYYEAWYRLIDEVRQAYPRTFFEGCASGGMRSDLHTLSHFDGHFLTDTVHPVDVLRISEGALLRLPPGRLTKWAVLRSLGRHIPRYTLSVAESPIAVATPGGALWEPAQTVDVDFAAAVCLPGMFGVSGDLASLPAEARDRLRRHIAFWKRWRHLIVGSIAHLLFPPRPLADRTGWSAIQLQHPQEAANLVFVYRLADARQQIAIPLRGLDPDATYTISQEGAAVASPIHCSGRELMREGLIAEAAAPYNAAIYLVIPSA